MKNIVAIVGRPNVGKSTLFNVLAGKDVAIVENTPGVTRDRIYIDVDWNGKSFTVVDTGGIEPKTNDMILKHMRRQAEIAIDTANVIVFMVDAKQGLTDADFQIASMLKKSRKQVIVVVNKLDNMRDITPMYEFYNLGLGDPFPISAKQKLAIGDMLDEIVKYIDDEEETIPDNVIKVAVIGKPNAGKSSLINRILNEERLVVSDVAGTTRDSIDTFVKFNGKEYMFIDTAGIRRKGKIEPGIEKYSLIRTLDSIEKCDVGLIMMDAEEGVTAQDTKIAGMLHEKGKGAILVMNKWDLIEKDNKTMKKYEEDMNEEFKYMDYAKKMFISAKTGQRVDKIFEEIDKIYENRHRRITTGVLNQVLYEAMELHETPNDKGRYLKIYYMTQVDENPPTFALFVNDSKLMHFSYMRYLENKLRENFDFSGTPIKLFTRAKGEEK
ncbi:MAG: ribosome biogenesis GTPase Der [Clostridia bacterium]|nr:ribosome biogenesis GTPase Der [Clostridia bacterium]